MVENVVKDFLKRGYLLEHSLINLLTEDSIANLPIVELVLKLKPPKLISKSFLINNLHELIEEIKKAGFDDERTVRATAYFSSLIKLLQGKEKVQEKKEFFFDSKGKVDFLEIQEPHIKKIAVEDFVSCFRDRFLTLKSFIHEHDINGLTSIGKLSNTRHTVSIVGMVSDIRTTKNKNLLFQLEDLTGSVSVIVNHEKSELFEKARYVVLDEVIAVKGTGSREIIFANDILFPDIAAKERKRASVEEYAIFTADLHVGSDKFLEENFLKFLDWLNGKIGSEKQRELASKIKYFFIVGDTVDGVGVYPKQEKELKIKDIKEQYKRLAEYLGSIRKDITIIMCPGGKHDAVRLIEPQPKIPKDVAPDLYELENLILTTNPSIIKIGKTNDFQGFNVLMYHGDSYDYYADVVDPLRFGNAKNSPDMIMHFLLKKRHLAPSHTSTTYYPGEKDYLIIRHVPDIFVSGHIHKSAISSYNNILTISCSCWQSKTAYQEKFGHEPDPCKVPMLNLKTGKVNVLDFS